MKNKIVQELPEPTGITTVSRAAASFMSGKIVGYRTNSYIGVLAFFANGNFGFVCIGQVNHPKFCGSTAHECIEKALNGAADRDVHVVDKISEL